MARWAAASIVTVLVAVPAPPADAASSLVEIGGVIYEIVGDPADRIAEVTLALPLVDGVIEPVVEINGAPYTVTGIADLAFRGNRVETIVIPATITSIGERAFEASRLTSITLPDSVTSIGSSAFTDAALTSVQLSASLTDIPNGAFFGNDLTRIELPAGLQSIGPFAFAENSLRSLTLPSTLTTIGSGAFLDNDIDEVVLPPHLTAIPDLVFGSNALTHITLPEGVTEVGENAFTDNRVRDVALPDSLEVIGVAAFSDNQIEEITIPAGVRAIRNAAFNRNPLRTVHMLGPPPVDIGGGAFPLIGVDSVPTIAHRWRYDAVRYPGGYTNPYLGPFPTRTRVAVGFATLDSEPSALLSIVDLGSPLALPPEPQRDGFRFTGWVDRGSGEPLPANLILSDDTLRASPADVRFDFELAAQWSPMMSSSPDDPSPPPVTTDPPSPPPAEDAPPGLDHDPLAEDGQLDETRGSADRRLLAATGSWAPESLAPLALALVLVGGLLMGRRTRRRMHALSRAGAPAPQ